EDSSGRSSEERKPLEAPAERLVGCGRSEAEPVLKHGGVDLPEVVYEPDVAARIELRQIRSSAENGSSAHASADNQLRRGGAVVGAGRAVLVHAASELRVGHAHHAIAIACCGHILQKTVHCARKPGEK